MPDFASLSLPMRAAVLLLVFLSVVAVVLTIAGLAGNRLAVRRRLDEGLAPTPSASGGASLRSMKNDSAWIRFVNAIEERGLSLADTKDESLRTKLIAAGYSHPSAPRLFTFLRLALTISLPGAFVLTAWLTANMPSFTKL